MKIGIDATVLTRELTGVGIYTARLIKALCEAIDEEQILLFAHKDLVPEIPEGDNLTIIKQYAPNFHIFLQTILPFLINKRDVDVFHGPNFYLPLLGNTPKVVTIHDLSAQLFPDQHSLKHRLSQKMLKPSLKAADKVIAVSKSTSRDLVEHGYAERAKIEVVHNGVDPEYTPQRKGKVESIKEKYALPDRFILFVGTLEPRKNVISLIEAFRELVSEGREMKLVLAGGKGWGYKEIYRRVEDLDLEERVIFTGYVPSDDLPALYSAAEIFCYPSLYEGFGLPPLEAARCKTPVVTSRRSSLPEIIGDGGLLVDPSQPTEIAQALLRILEDHGLRKELVEKGKRRAEQFTWKRCARKTLEIYKDLT